MDAQKRQGYINSINKKEKPPTDSELRSLREHGCESWGEHVVSVAENSGISVRDAYSIFDMLGTNEAFDGFITECDDAAMMMEESEEEMSE